MNRNEAIAYLTQCADDNGTHWHGGRAYPLEECPTCKGTNDAGHLRTPCSRYGRTSSEVAPVAYRHALIIQNWAGKPLTRESLSHSMSMVVNDHEDVEKDIREYAAELASVPGKPGANVDAMTRGYLEAQLWLQRTHASDIENESDYAKLDENYSLDDIDSEYIDQIRGEFADLVVAHPLAVRMYLNNRQYDPSQGSVSSYFGHDYYLTREHHGAGFWDRGLGELGRYLTDIAHYAGSADDLYDNGNGVLIR